MTALCLTLCLLASTLAALGFYLATAHQRLWTGAVPHARRLRIAAWLCSALALAAAVAALGLWAGMFAMLTAWMLAAVLLPYLDAWRQLRRSAADVG